LTGGVTFTDRPPTSHRIPPALVAVLLLLVMASVVAGLAFQSRPSSPSTTTSRSSATGSPSSAPARPTSVVPTEQTRPLGEADGVIPEGTTVFDDDVPGVAKLDSGLLRALRRAATDAARDGIEFQVNSGWRSAAYEEQLLREATSKYGSEREAARWVATPDTSAHVSGDAVDLGGSDATAWLALHGSRYGLCQIYRNEPWHYELRPTAVHHGCPRMYADAAHDPRMQQ
jgi:D-alanyl-D-alanine carboxypeptidase